MSPHATSPASRRALATAALLALLPASGLAHAGGRVVLANDEWTLSTTGFVAPNDPGTFALNVVDFFTGGQPASILIYSANFGLNNTSLKSVLQGGGHAITQSTDSGMLANLAAYDAVFITAITADNQLLIDYVEQGGNIYLCFGTGAGSDQSFTAFLSHFGMAITDLLGGSTISLPISSPHPIFAGVDHLYQWNGNGLVDLDANDDSAILVTLNGNGMYAVHDPTTCSDDPDLDGSGAVDGADLGILLGAWGTGACPGDLNGDGTVDGADLGIVLGAWAV